MLFDCLFVNGLISIWPLLMDSPRSSYLARRRRSWLVASQLVLCSLYFDIHWALHSLDSASVCWFVYPLVLLSLDSSSHWSPKSMLTGVHVVVWYCLICVWQLVWVTAFGIHWSLSMSQSLAMAQSWLSLVVPMPCYTVGSSYWTCIDAVQCVFDWLIAWVHVDEFISFGLQLWSSIKPHSFPYHRTRWRTWCWWRLCLCTQLQLTYHQCWNVMTTNLHWFGRIIGVGVHTSNLWQLDVPLKFQLF